MTDQPVTFITGAASGIGRATALTLAERGYAVGLLDLAGDATEDVATEIRAAGGRALAIAGDVSQAMDVQQAVDATVAAFGRLSTAVACAGIVMTGDITTMDLSDWRRVFAVNVDGVMHTARFTLASIRRRGAGGAFVAVSSDAGVLGAADWAPYTASKHAVIGLIRSLALDYGPEGIRSNIVAPAFVETAMTDRIFEGAEDERSTWKKRIPLQRFAEPREVARVIAHLLSDEASFTNGHIYMVDGGETAGIMA